MNTRDELTILQSAIRKAVGNGYLSSQDKSVAGVDYILDPPSISVQLQSVHDRLIDPIYFDTLFPLWEREWAEYFWGRQLVGDQYYGLMSAWKYHQHKLLSFWQENERDEFFQYIQLFL